VTASVCALTAAAMGIRTAVTSAGKILELMAEQYTHARLWNPEREPFRRA
jgi:hypothetical protein